MATINHRPCVTDDEIIDRIISDQMEIQLMKDDGYPVTAAIGWHSDSTLETHAIPIFATDTMEDVINRYDDYFPKECHEAMTEAAAMRETLYSPDGFSKERTIMASFKIPLGLYKILEIWHEGFFAVENRDHVFVNAGLVREFLNYMPRLKTNATA